jgi:hypothetical protein
MHKTLAGAMHQQLALLLDRLDGHEAHFGPGNGLADGGCIIFAVLVREAVGDDELGRYQAHRVAELLELARAQW